ncbi:MAG TPA: 3-dehydroquinate synthase [Armatimonadota bacterium]
MQNIRVELGDRSYPIVVRAGLLRDAAGPIRDAVRGRKLLLVSHPKLLALYGEALASRLRGDGFDVAVSRVPEGERSKSLSAVSRLYAAMANAGMDRHSAVVALGGGVIGDLAGFAAATYLRGIDVVQVPTTLLAMVDSAIGGKTGVNLPIGKNLVGAFHQPRAVLVDPETLCSLPRRDVRSGLAEVIKYGVIAEPGLFAFLEANMGACLEADPSALARCIADSAACKARVVGADEREGGLRAILNYGHTAGHAVEKAAGYRKLRHGEAVAIGMVAAARIGLRLGITPSDAVDRMESLIARAGLPVRVPPGIAAGDLVHTMAFDKKAKGGTVKWVMATRIGEVKTGVEVPDALAREVLVEIGAETA